LVEVVVAAAVDKIVEVRFAGSSIVVVNVVGEIVFLFERFVLVLVLRDFMIIIENKINYLITMISGKKTKKQKNGKKKKLTSPTLK